MGVAALFAGQRWWPGASMGPRAAPAGVPPSIEATEVDVWPPRVLLAATGLSAGHTVTIYRGALGVRTPVRGADAITTTDVSLVRVDAEEPFGIQLTYVLSVDGIDVDSTVITVNLPGGDVVAATDAVTGAAASIRVVAWPERTRARQATTFTVAGRAIVVAAPRGGFSGQLDVYTDTTAAADNFDALLQHATAATIQLRAPIPLDPAKHYDRFDCYIAVLADTEKRWSQDGSDPQRLWSLDVVEVGPWDPSLSTRGFTYGDVALAYTGLTYADLARGYGSYLAMDQGDFS
jgi:hypothetical protein